MKTALVTGAYGQDGYYMVEYLRGKEEEYGHVYAPKKENCDITSPFFATLLKDLRPDEVYNFGGNSDNLKAFDYPIELLEANVKPVITILQYLKDNPKAKFFQASSSLIFGESVSLNDRGIPYQGLNTPMNPTTPYGASKLYAYNLIQTYKKHYNVFAVNGILYNHESIRRKDHFVLPKIVKGAIECKMRNRGKLQLGDLNVKRDWIHAKDVVRGAYLSLQTPGPNDWIFCSGKFTSLQYVVEYVFNKMGLYWDKCIEINPDFINKKQENNYLGDPSRTEWGLGWKSNYTIEDILNELIDHYEKLLAG